MASTIARKSLRMHAVRLASHLAISTRPERRLLNVTSLSSHRRVLLKLKVPELALLRLEVRDHDEESQDEFEGQTSLPIHEIRDGYRCVHYIPIHHYLHIPINHKIPIVTGNAESSEALVFF
ncbi:hypothetical protein M758_11G008400 [Ceratodon purpureus]|nr:hypothetical protein M758_11G008400 [Ceratodon purpureus]